jgi:hypothetical protein
MKTVAALAAGIMIGTAGTGIAGSNVVDWRHSKPHAYSCYGSTSRDLSLVTCVSPKRDWAGGRLQVTMMPTSVIVTYRHPRRGGPIYVCRTGRVPVGYMGGLGGWRGCR